MKKSAAGINENLDQFGKSSVKGRLVIIDMVILGGGFITKNESANYC